MTILAIDYGTRRVGVATSDSGVLATPHSVIPNLGDRDDLVAAIARLADELGDIEMIVVGVPRGGGRRDAAAIDERFAALAEALRQRSCKSVVLWDEAYSTTEAISRRREARGRHRRLKDEVDMEAAAVILQSYLDATRRSESRKA